MPTILGIDLGAHTIKLSLMEGGFGRYQFSDIRLRRVPQGIDTPPTLEGRLSALTDLMGELKDVTITGNDAVFGGGLMYGTQAGVPVGEGLVLGAGSVVSRTTATPSRIRPTSPRTPPSPPPRRSGPSRAGRPSCSTATPPP